MAALYHVTYLDPASASPAAWRAGTMQSSRVQCVTLLGRSSTPLYLRAVGASAGDASEMKWYFLAHSALDVMGDRASRGTNPYLGLLTTLEDTAIYGFQTNTHVKILLMLQLRDDPLSDVDVVTMFKAVHAAYVAYISNPFAHTLPGELPGATDSDDTPVRPAAPPSMDDASRPIWSAAFERRIDAIAGWRPAVAEPTEAA